jgi:hypothetical protein
MLFAVCLITLALIKIKQHLMISWKGSHESESVYMEAFLTDNRINHFPE